MKRMPLIALLCVTLLLPACASAPEVPAADAGGAAVEQVAGSEATAPAAEPAAEPAARTTELAELRLTIDGTELPVEWEDNESVEALAELVADGPLVVQTSSYGGFEQVGSLGAALPNSDVQMQTSPGDIVLYSSNQIVVFFGSNSWAYTKLGRIVDTSAAELTELLGGDTTTLKLEIA